MPTFRRLLSRLVRLGIDDGVPETRAKHIILANIAAYIGILVNVPYLPLVWSKGSALWGVALATYWAAMGVGLWFRARARHWLAHTFLILTAFGWTSVALFVFGSQQLGYLYFLAISVLAFFVYPPEHTRTMWTVAVCGAVAFLASILTKPLEPILPLGEDETLDRVINVAGFVSMLLALAYYERRVVHDAEAKLDEERRKSDDLLCNVLPLTIAARLKERGETIADTFREVTVLFADVAGFTPMSSRLSAEAVVEMLNRVFTEFDRLADKYGLEKIKTIGDAYMVAGGLPEPRADHSQAVAGMALEMLGVLAGLQTPTGDRLDLRIGMNTGPVVAGVIGKRKFSYDLWGDTVNTASRMESHGVPGRIHVTQAVHDTLVDSFHFEERGAVEVKGKGTMVTYFLLGRAEPK